VSNVVPFSGLIRKLTSGRSRVLQVTNASNVISAGTPRQTWDEEHERDDSRIYTMQRSDRRMGDVHQI